VLNCLLLAVGWLYWKGLNSFYNIKGIRSPWLYSQTF
jgi:hypothetical protein